MTFEESLTRVLNPAVRTRAVRALAARKVVLPTFAELADPLRMDPARRGVLESINPDEPHPENLFRVHWHNDASRTGMVDVPDHIVLPSRITGVASPIVVLFGDRFPMIAAHKVLAAYACLVPRIVSGSFDPTQQRALWPSTGNYCRGGVAISRIMGCRGVAILPAEMSAERFAWLDRWVASPDDVIRTPGSESNVKEIYDACATLERDPANLILNQFREMPNHLAHRCITGLALEKVFLSLQRSQPDLSLRAFVSATGSAGTLGAGDYLKEKYNSAVVAVEALECPTLLRNGYGSHNIQGIGDKHVPFIHNVMGTDVVVGISDHATDALFAIANDPDASPALDALELGANLRAALPHFGLSSWCNVLACIKTAKALGLGPNEALMTIATDGATLYPSELPRIRERLFSGQINASKATAAWARYLEGAGIDDVLELRHEDRLRIFNLGYFTWVEQRGVSLSEFERRKSRAFWNELPQRVLAWDSLIGEFNAEARTQVS